MSALTVVGALWPAAASAQWLRAETDRFIVYSRGREAQLREYAVKLTTFDAVLRSMSPAPRKPVARKLEVYLVDSAAELRRVRPGLSSSTLGLYTAGTGGTFAIADRGGGGLDTDDVLFHEYGHHFMLENFPAGYPGWFVEGWAEYFMATEIVGRTVKVGGYNVNRVYWLFNAPWLPMEDVLSKSPWQIPRERRHLFYSQAWLLTHYMRSDPVRAKQLNEAIFAIANGEQPLPAMQKATGMTVAELTKALRGYQKLPGYKFTDVLKTPPVVTVTRLPPSADDLLLDHLRLVAQRDDTVDPKFLADVRRRAAKWPDDRYAELVWGEAEFAHGDIAAGEAIVQRRLDANTNDVEALLLAGTGQLTAGHRRPDTRLARARAARPYLIKAHKLNEDDYRVLFAYAVSRMAEPGFPNENDLNALLAARALAPTVDPITVMAGQALLKHGERERAEGLLAIVANNPHGGPLSAQARALMEGKSTSEAEAAAAAEAEADLAPPDDAGGKAGGKGEAGKD
ncbi:MAG: hypothetical protein C0481_14920 [Phenylobacterium sp.]|uniref:hypothetical protein n=1 Tax=Phenylobacterium sp. TaxID=1871053 RepID=UPI0025CCF3DC|nr:hypothetical protein [Phenylobacterium sp.]MBA4013156.1 hypothetical protein [Phenylobacterium sp.]